LKDNVTWTVVDNILDSTEQSRQATVGQAAGLRAGLPGADGDIDLLALWLTLYPGSIEDDLQRLNSQASLRKSTYRPVSMSEWVTFWGLVLGARQFHVRGKDLWESKSVGLQPAPNFGQYMSWGRFQLIREMAKYSKADMDSQPSDPWFMFRRAVQDFNANRAATVLMQLVQVLDEAMSNWQPRKDKLGGLPNISYIQRKPRPLGTEMKCVADAVTGMMVHLEIQEGRDAMRKARLSAEQGVTAACTVRLADAVGDNAVSRTYVADSWFGSVKVCMQCVPVLHAMQLWECAVLLTCMQCNTEALSHMKRCLTVLVCKTWPLMQVDNKSHMSMQAAVEVSKLGQHLIACVKTSHAHFPKDWLLTTLQPLPAGSRVVLTSTVNGQDLMAVGYKYNRRKVLFFVATRGAGVTTDGQPYLQRFPDAHGNLVVREVPRPAVVSKYFEVSPRVDNHNQSRQDDLGLEELWQTQDCFFRLHCTLAGMHATDCWKAARFHLAAHHPLKNASMQTFADRLATALVVNNLTSTPDSTRASLRKRPLADVTNTPAMASTDAHTVGHFQVPKKGGKNRQVRCKWCSVTERRESWTSYYCEACGFGLCAPNAGHNRTCWAQHAECTKDELNKLKWRRG
jgi:hypothetical protein